MYKFLMIETKKDEEILLTYDMVCQKFGFNNQQMKKSLNKFVKNGIIISYTEYETKNVEIYNAILNQDYDKINKLANEIK